MGTKFSGFEILISATFAASLLACSANSSTRADVVAAPDLQDVYIALLGKNGEAGLRLNGRIEDFGDRLFQIDFTPSSMIEGTVTVPPALVEDVLSVEAFNQIAHQSIDVPTGARAFDIRSVEGATAIVADLREVEAHLPLPQPFRAYGDGLIGAYMKHARVMEHTNDARGYRHLACPGGGQGHHLRVAYGSHYSDHVHVMNSYETDIRTVIRACPTVQGVWDFTLMSIVIADPRVTPGFEMEVLDILYPSER